MQDKFDSGVLLTWNEGSYINEHMTDCFLLA